MVFNNHYFNKVMLSTTVLSQGNQIYVLYGWTFCQMYHHVVPQW